MYANATQQDSNLGSNLFASDVSGSRWSVDDIIAAMPALPSLRYFTLQLPANAAETHRPSRRQQNRYAPQASSLPMFRIVG